MLRTKAKIIVYSTILILILAIILSINWYKNEIFLFIKSQKEVLIYFVDYYEFTAIFLFFILTFIFVNTPIPLAALIKIVGGFIFGFYYGAIINILATTIASMGGFYAARELFSKELHEKYGNKFKKVNKELESNGFLYLIMLRFSLVFPYFLINILSGLSRNVSTTKYILSTFISVIPASFVYAYAGNKLESLNSLNDIFSIEIISLFCILFIFTIISILIKKYFIFKKKEKTKESTY